MVLEHVPVAFKTYGSLSPGRDNAMVICHALTGSADVSDWWGPLLGGQDKAFDTTRFFVVCVNSLGSPYGSASPVTARDGDLDRGHYGPEFPLTTIRDDVNIFKAVLDDLGVKQIAAVIGGSMGGMLVLEFAYFGRDYVRTIIPIATSARYSAWGISWGEAQRQCIYSDPKYDDGYYLFDDPPSTGLGAARMSALLTYRSRDSFETRFGRNTPDPLRKQNINGERPISNEHFAIHNDGHKHAGSPRPASQSGSVPQTPTSEAPTPGISPAQIQKRTKRTPHYYSAQSYLRYQGEKFIKRFDANCYIAITRKLDTHDVSRGRVPNSSAPGQPSEITAVNALTSALNMIEQPTLVLGIQSDGLFTYAEQQELAKAIPNSTLKTIDSSEGHDAFLLEFEQVNGYLKNFMREALPDIMAREPMATAEASEGFNVQKESVFGEAEGEGVEEITAW